MSKHTHWTMIILFFCVLVVLILSLSLLTATHPPLLSTTEQLEKFDFKNNVGKIDECLFGFYPEKLYSPTDFKNKNLEKSNNSAVSSKIDRQLVTYGTYHIEINLPKGMVFAISADSATFSQKLWVNGKLLLEVGKVADNKENFIPLTKHYTVCFTSSGAKTEIIIQRANFVHNNGSLFDIKLGPQEQVFQSVTLNLFRSVSALGILLTSALFFIGISIFFPRQKRFHWFSLSCFFIFIRNCFISPKPIMILFPNLNWFFGHKLECCSMILFYLFMLLFYDSVFSNMVAKPIRYTGYCICLSGFCMYAFLPSTIYSKLTRIAVYVLALYLVVYVIFFIIGLIRKKIQMNNTSNILMFCGIFITIFCSISDQFLYLKTADYNFSQIGILVFIIALTMQMRETKENMDEVTIREKQMRQKAQELSNLYRMRSDFMADISHELKTPLTVMSSYARLTKMQLDKNAVNINTPSNLETIQNEALRLGALVEQLKSVSSDKNQKLLTSVRTDVVTTLKKAADFCKPICDKNCNCIKVVTPNEPLFAFYVPDSILQVLYNLITNANRHCKDSAIFLMAKSTGSTVTVTVSDTGDGIKPEIMSKIFERGVSGANSSGLGLALCRDIIENGGDIYIKSELGQGTSVVFTLPREEI